MNGNEKGIKLRIGIVAEQSTIYRGLVGVLL